VKGKEGMGEGEKDNLKLRLFRYSTPQAVVSVNGEKKDVPGEDLTPDYM